MFVKSLKDSQVSSISGWVPDRICGATGLCPEVQSTINQVGWITVRVRWPGGNAQFAFLFETEIWRRGWFMAQDVGVFSIKVVM